VGVPARLPVDESFPDQPCTIYDMHKLQAEQYLKHYARGGIVRGASLRLANVYGPGPKSGSADRGVLNAMVRRALRGETLTIYGTGESVRDYVYVEDAARCFARAAASVEAVNGRHFVVGSGVGHTVAQAVRLVAELVTERVGRPVRVEHTPAPATLSPIESRNFVARVDAFDEATGFRPGIQLSDGIQRTIDYLLASVEG
jgi:nucleoside-diphosphate-sugar epimerase